MLYSTTANSNITFDPSVPLVQNFTENGEIYVPQAFPILHQDAISSLCNKTFGQNVADIINLFFDSELTGWDVDFSIGRNTTRYATLNGKLLIVESWHTPDDHLEYITNRLYTTLCKEDAAKSPTEWFRICIRIALLCAMFGELLRQDALQLSRTVDLALPGDDLVMFLAAFYAKKMGLPIDSLIVTGTQNKAFWNLIHRGDIYLSARSADIAVCVERLIHATLGSVAAHKFRQVFRQGQVFRIEEDLLSNLNSGIFCIITGSERAKQTINSVYRANQYILDPDAAICIGGLQDHRARRGKQKLTVIISEQSPRLHLDYISSATGLSADKLAALFNTL